MLCDHKALCFASKCFIFAHMNVIGAKDYREVLIEAYGSKCAKNPRYSQRAFARDLQFSSGAMSLILQGKQGLSQESARRITERLSMNVEESEYFCTLVESQDSRSPTSRAMAQAKLTSIAETYTSQHNLQLDAFRVISDWYHFAIHQLMKLPQCTGQSEWIAKNVGVSRAEAELALERLERLELIERHNGRWRPVEESLITPTGTPSEALRKFHTQILEKALGAITLQPLNKRYFYSSVFPVNENDIPEIGRKIQQFQRRIIKEYSRAKRNSRIYALSNQFFDLLPELGERT